MAPCNLPIAENAVIIVQSLWRSRAARKKVGHCTSYQKKEMKLDGISYDVLH